MGSKSASKEATWEVEPEDLTDEPIKMTRNWKSKVSFMVHHLKKTNPEEIGVRTKTRKLTSNLSLSPSLPKEDAQATRTREI